MNTIQLLRRDKRVKSGLFRFDLKKRLYAFVNNSCGKPGQKFSRKLKDEEDLSFFDSYSVIMLSNVKYSLFARKVYNTRLYSISFICKQTGRPRGLVSKFFLSRMVIKQLTSQGILPGLKRASW